MKYTKIRDVEVSRVMMGCMRIADKPLADIEKLIIEAMRAGINAFDHADIYGKGDCEKVFGVAVRDLGIAREDYVIQSKCGIRKNEMGKWFDFSKEHIVQSAEDSLRRLNVEYLDFFLLHRPDSLIEPEEVAEAFDYLQNKGMVRHFGVSNFSAQQIELLKRYGVDVTVNQMQFSLGHTALVDSGFFVNMFENEAITRAGDALEYCRANDITLQAWSPLQYGFFKGTFIDNEEFPQLNAELGALAEKYGVTKTAIACAWILRHPARMQVVTGTTSFERLEQMSKGADIELTREEWYRLYMSTGKVLP